MTINHLILLSLASDCVFDKYLILPSFAKAPDSNRGMTSEEGTLRSSARSEVGYASEGFAPKNVKKPPAPAGGASLFKLSETFLQYG